VARAVWACRPDFKTACAAWIYAGGSHHTVFSHPLGVEHLRDFAAIANIEIAAIDGKTNLQNFRESLRNAEIYFHLGLGLGQM